MKKDTRLAEEDKRDVGAEGAERQPTFYNLRSLVEHCRSADNEPECLEPDALALKNQPAHMQGAVCALLAVEQALASTPVDAIRRDLLGLHVARWALRSIGHPRGFAEKTLDDVLKRLLGTGGVLADAVDTLKLAASALECEERDNSVFGLSPRDDEFAAGVVEHVQREMAHRRPVQPVEVERVLEAYRGVKPGRPLKGESRSKRDERNGQAAELIGSRSNPKNAKRQGEKARARKKNSR